MDDKEMIDQLVVIDVFQKIERDAEINRHEYNIDPFVCELSQMFNNS